MQKLKINDIIKRIKRQETFDATAFDNSFRIKITKYVPYCCTAIHDGSNFREQLKKKISLDEFQRWFEEDPHTGEFITAMPITISGLDSRFEYDLNRRPEDCIYEEAWGDKVWNRPLTPTEKQTSKQKHFNFYKVVYAIVSKLEELYGSCVVYDLHSYNYQRWERDVPLFNVGTEGINQKKYNVFVDNWIEELKSIKLDGINNKTKINDVFKGRGYNLEFITKNFKNTLVLATEVKKVYCNELTGEDYPKIIRELQQKLKNAILNNAQFFSENNTNWKSKNSSQLLDKKMDPAIESVDKKLFKLLRNFELLASVNPVNTYSQKKQFIRNKFTVLPEFKYAPIKINPFELKQQLSSLRIQDISDVSIRLLYESVVNSYFDKIDLLSSLGTKKFLYNSLGYFGRPSAKDLDNANYILHLPAIPSEPKRVPFLSQEQVITCFKEGLDNYGIKSKIELSKRVISQVMVLNSKKTILINPNARFTQKDVNALIEHEIGVHMVTTQNSIEQNLKLFNLGLPVNTETQEGLAILSEYLSGNITLKRLKKLALRVVIVDMMCSGANFSDCFNFLVGHQDVSVDDAYTIVTRVFRGGGFTKDYLYLSGFEKVLKLWKSDTNLSPLLVGKTSIEFYDTIREMIQREMITKPKYITKSILNPIEQKNNSIYEYILTGLN